MSVSSIQPAKIRELTEDVCELIAATATARAVYQAAYNEMWRNYFDAEMAISACDKLARIFSYDAYKEYQRFEAELDIARERLATERLLINHAV